MPANTAPPPAEVDASTGPRSVPSTATATAIAVDGLTKRYGSRTAVDHLSFTVPTGTVAGLVGPNGAGKTTVMAMLLGLVLPSEGTAQVLGQPVDRPRAFLPRVGALIEAPAFHPAVSAVDNLRSLAVLGGHPTGSIEDLVDLVGLTGRAGDHYGSYSLGMKQRLGIAAALLGDPEMVILDEPTNGLDPVGINDMRRLIGDIAAAGRTVLVSSHLLSELEQVCDWLVVIDQGGLVYEGPPDSLLAGTDALVVRTGGADGPADLHALVASTGLPTVVEGDDVVVTLDGEIDVTHLAAEINRRSHAAGITLVELHHRRSDLETRYLTLVSEGGPR